jgi:hypothetical protein
MTTTDTPRTDAARERYYDGKTSDWVHYTIGMMLERELAASKAEVKEIQAALGDDLLEWKISNCTLSAEVAKLNHQLLKTESDLLQSQDINSFLDTEFRIACKRAEKAEKELAEIKEAINPTDK